jgi:Tfp pilus assembly protein PilN
MINLLPPENKERLLQEEKWRMILILQIIFLSFLICLVLILGLVSIYISGRAKVQKIILAEEEKRFEGSEAQEFQEKIIFFGKELGRVNNFYENQPNLVEQFENISKTLPSGVYLTTLSLTSQKEIPAQKEKKEFRFLVTLSGFSPDRETLFQFKKNLEAEENFQEIYLPPVSWAKPTNIQFNLTFKIK